MNKLIVNWSEDMSKEELDYKNKGFIKTKGSIFNVIYPTNNQLIDSFNLIENELSLGAIALCKHINRNKDYYPEISGNKDQKNKIANDFIEQFLKSNIVWKNIHELNKRIIYELRNDLNYGMRWYIENNTVVFRGILEPYTSYLEFKEKSVKI